MSRGALNYRTGPSLACLLAVGVLGGCGGNKNPADAPATAPSLATVVADPSSEADAAATAPAEGPPQVTELTQRSEEYARHLMELLEKRRAATTRAKGPSAAPPTTLPVQQTLPVPEASVSQHTVETPATAPASQPATSQPSLAESLGDQLHRRWAAEPANLLAALDDQFYAMINGQAVPDPQVLSSLSAEDRQAAEALISGMSGIRQTLSQARLMQAAKARPLLEMADRLRGLAPLQIPAAVLCTRADGFGVYEPIEPAQFLAMRETSVVLYCEVAGFSSHLNARKQWETKLSQELTLYGEQGQVVWRDKPMSMTDSCRTRRTDFFFARVIRLPATLAAGKYILKVGMTDLSVNQVAEATLPVQISGR